MRSIGRKLLAPKGGGLVSHRFITKILPAAAALLLAAGCQQLDVIGNGSVEALGAVMAALPNEVAMDDRLDAWSLEAPDGTARFLWGSSGGEYRISLELDARPFLEAGLEPALLPAGMLQGDRIVVGAGLGSAPAADEATPLGSYRQLVRLWPGRISHHAAMDHFGVDLGGGNQFEWARDMAANDKDIVFALEPDIFLAAGADLHSIEGWAYAEVETMDDSMSHIVVEKLLKPFDLV